MVCDQTLQFEGNVSGLRNRRLKILAQDEVKEIYGLPCFSDEEKEQYFSLTSFEMATFENLHSVRSKIAFILQLGYFRARRLFFVFNASEVKADMIYVVERYFHGIVDPDCTITKVTRLKHQRMILKLCRYRVCDDDDRHHLETKTRDAAKVSSKPIYVFRKILLELEAQRITLPGYSFLQDMVGRPLSFEQNRLADILREQLETSDKVALNALLEDESGFRHISQLKREPKEFSLSEIKREIDRGAQIKDLYQLSKRVLPTLEISNESIKYYASLVGYYSIFRLKRFSSWTISLYLLCFTHHRYQRHYDNLLASFIFYVRKFIEAAKTVSRERIYKQRVEVNQNLCKAAQVLKIFTVDEIADNTPFREVQTRAFSILEREKLDHVADHITSQIYFDETAFQWEHVDKLGFQFKRYLRPILLTVNFKGSPTQTRLIEAIDFLEAAFEKSCPLRQYSVGQAAPTAFIHKNAERYVLENDGCNGKSQIIPDRYEFYVYRLLRNRLESGDIYSRDSIRFRSFEDDLIDEKTWSSRKKELIARTGLPMLKQTAEENLFALEQELEGRIASVNQRIDRGENTHIKIKKVGAKSGWSLQYPGDRDETNHPVFDRLKQVDIGSILNFGDRHCHLIDAFEHVLGRYIKTSADNKAISAAILAWATNTGLGRMGQISDISYSTLAATSDNFIRLETLREANDRIITKIVGLPISSEYDIDGLVHSSSDGQKFETGIPTFNARHSPKYFGLKKGIVAYTMVANHIPVNARIIGANEHESHYVFDVLFNNTSEVQPDIHSTDTHGTNEVNFAILHLFGYQFAPRYKNIVNKVTTSLYGFRHPSHYDGLLKPVRQINKGLIIDDWDWIQRIMVSLALKSTTQSIITGKLSAYARQNKTRAALWEYDNIIRSLYLLRYIDEPLLRRHVQLALNRGESYHKLRKAVAFANFGKLRFKTEQEQQIWQECSRLVTNCIIFYNATILSKLLIHRERTGDIEGALQLKKVSPIAWQHINLHGRYEFTKNTDVIDIGKIISTLTQVAIEELQLI